MFEVGGSVQAIFGAKAVLYKSEVNQNLRKRRLIPKNKGRLSRPLSDKIKVWSKSTALFLLFQQIYT